MFRYFRIRRARSRFDQAWRIGDWRAAIEACELLLKEAPDDPEILNNLGVALLEVGEAIRSEPHLHRANNLRENAIHSNNLGRALLACGRHTEAKAAFQRASELDPNGDQPRYNLIICLREEGRLKEATDELTRFVSEFPHHAAGQNDLGCLVEERGELEQALIHYTVCLDNSPHYLRARLNLVRLLCELGRYPEATPHLQALATSGVNVRVNASDTDVEIDLNGKPFYRGSVKKA